MRWMTILALGLLAVPSFAQVTFALASPAVKGKPEVGFDSKLVSAGRADPAYNGPTSLPFSWSGLPAGTKALALIYDDPDARLVMKAFNVPGESWIHWLATDINPALGGLKADASSTATFAQGSGSSGEAAYRGPSPPANVPADVPRPIIHIYRLTVYALSAPTKLDDGFSVDDLKAAMAGKILGHGQINLSWSN